MMTILMFRLQLVMQREGRLQQPGDDYDDVDDEYDYDDHDDDVDHDNDHDDGWLVVQPELLTAEVRGPIWQSSCPFTFFRYLEKK